MATISAADLRAEAIFDKANQEAHAYIGCISLAPTSQAAIEARLGNEIGILHSEIRKLCFEAEANAAAADEVQRLRELCVDHVCHINELRAFNKVQRERIEQLEFDAYKGDEDDGDRSEQRFTANDAARAAAWSDV